MQHIYESILIDACAVLAGSSGAQKYTQACGVVWMHTRAMSGMTCGGTRFPMKTDTSARSAVHGSLPLAHEHDFACFKV